MEDVHGEGLAGGTADLTFGSDKGREAPDAAWSLPLLLAAVFDTKQSSPG